MKRPQFTNNELILLISIVCLMYLYLCRRALFLQKQLHTHFTFITMNTHTVVYFESIPHTPSCCFKHSPEHQMCINPQLKIVPDKCTIYLLYGNVC